MEIFQNTIIKIVVRQGTDTDRKSIVLASGEPCYTTDLERMFIGNGYTNGGVVVGNKCFGKSTYVTDFSPAIPGDIGYGEDMQRLYVLRTGDGSNISDWDVIGGGVYLSGDKYINVSTNNEISLNKLSANSIDPDLLVPNSPLSFDNDGRLGISLVAPLCSTSGTMGLSTVGLLNLIYPIGSIYLSMNSANPGIQWAGTTWVQVSEGRFLVGVGTATDADSTTRTFTLSNNAGLYEQNNVPPHTHYIAFNYKTSNSGNSTLTSTNHMATSRDKPGVGTKEYALDGVSSTPNVGLTSDVVGGGGTATSENCPMSFGIYVWRRTG